VLKLKTPAPADYARIEAILEVRARAYDHAVAAHCARHGVDLETSRYIGPV
jgi:hypothetical protein